MSFESLEPRQMLAADVAIGADAGYIEPDAYGDPSTVEIAAAVAGNEMAGQNSASVGDAPTSTLASEPMQGIDNSLIDEFMASEDGEIFAIEAAHADEGADSPSQAATYDEGSYDAYGGDSTDDFGGEFVEESSNDYGGQYAEESSDAYGGQYAEESSDAYGGQHAEESSDDYGGQYAEQVFDDYGGEYAQEESDYGGQYADETSDDHSGQYVHDFLDDYGGASEIPDSPQFPFFESTSYSNSIREDAEPGVILSVSAEDPQGDQVTYSIDRIEYTNLSTGRLSRVTSNPFTIDADTGAISLAEQLDYETTRYYNLVVRASDPSDNSSTSSVAIHVEDVEESPTFSAPSYDASITENTVGPLTTVSASDPQSNPTNPYSHPLTYSLPDDLDGLFAIDSFTGEITLTHAVDHEDNSSYQLEVNVTDPDNYSDTASVQVAILDVDEAPTFTSSNAITVQENTIELDHQLAASDPEGQQITFAIIGGDDGHRFVYDNGTLKLKDPVDFENPADANRDNVYEVEVEAKDPAGNTASQTLRVTVVNANDAPTFAKDEFVFVTSKKILKNGMPIGPDVVLANDVDGDSITFSISGDALLINESGQISIKDAGLVGDAFASEYMYKATVTVSDGEFSDTSEILVYDDHEPYLEEIRGVIGTWDNHITGFLISSHFNARDAVSDLVSLIKGNLSSFKSGTNDATSLGKAWLSLKSPMSGQLSVYTVVQKIIVEVVSTHIEKGYEETLKAIHDRTKEVFNQERERAKQIVAEEHAALSQLVAEIRNDPQDVKTRRVVEYLAGSGYFYTDGIQQRLTTNAEPPTSAKIYGDLLLEFARTKDWRIHGNQSNLNNFGEWWSATGIGTPWFNMHDLANELNRIGHR